MATEKRLIDANAMREYWLEYGQNEFVYDANSVLDSIDEQPTVDAVEVVRCKDCKWYKPGDLFTDIMFCHRLKKENGKPAKYNFCGDDFCSYGERRTDD